MTPHTHAHVPATIHLPPKTTAAQHPTPTHHQNHYCPCLPPCYLAPCYLLLVNSLPPLAASMRFSLLPLTRAVTPVRSFLTGPVIPDQSAHSRAVTPRRPLLIGAVTPGQSLLLGAAGPVQNRHAWPVRPPLASMPPLTSPSMAGAAGVASPPSAAGQPPRPPLRPRTRSRSLLVVAATADAVVIGGGCIGCGRGLPRLPPLGQPPLPL